MNRFAYSGFEDADIILFVVDLFEDYTGEEKVITLLKKAEVQKFLIVNKIDLDKEKKVESIVEKWKGIIEFDEIHLISAKNNVGIDELRSSIVSKLPEGPEYYPKDQLTDKPERFFVSEIIRENILIQYKQEIPYSSEVTVEEFIETTSRSGPIINIRAVIYVDRKTQKAIIIGHQGNAIKKLGTAARLSIEAFFNKHVFLELYVNVKENWRDTERNLTGFGYDG